MITVTLGDVVARILGDSGIDRAYGSPGTCELPLLAALVRRGMQPHVLLHDTVACAAAIGEARWRGKPSLVVLHATQGVLNAAGMIRVALRDEVPLLVLAGAPSLSYAVHEPNHYLHGLGQVVAAITKQAWTVTHPSQAERVVRRALVTASTPACGPVFIAVPQDLMAAPVPEPESRPVVVPAATLPESGALERAAGVIAAAKHPVILTGAEARRAASAVGDLALAMAAPVIGEALDRGSMVAGFSCPPDHPLFLGLLSRQDTQMLRALHHADVVVFVGTKAAYPRIIGELATGCRTVQICHQEQGLEKDRSVDIPLLGGISLTVSSLARALRQRLGDGGRMHQERRSDIELLVRQRIENRARALRQIPLEGGEIRGVHLVAALARTLPDDAVIVDDSQSFTYYLKRYFPFRRADALMGSMASHIGFGVAAATGVKHAAGDRPVVCLTGDSGFLYSLQGLAAGRVCHAPFLVVVANNRSQVSLKLEVDQLGNDLASLQEALSFTEPPFDLTAMARALGSEGSTVADRGELIGALQAGIETVMDEGLPFLVDVRMSSDPADWQEAWPVDPLGSAG